MRVLYYTVAYYYCLENDSSLERHACIVGHCHVSTTWHCSFFYPKIKIHCILFLIHTILWTILNWEITFKFKEYEWVYTNHHALLYIQQWPDFVFRFWNYQFLQRMIHGTNFFISVLSVYLYNAARGGAVSLDKKYAHLVV